MSIKEIKRLQKLAGILNESNLKEAREIDQKLAQIIFDRLVSTNRNFEEEIYLSLNDREHIKKLYGGRLPITLASPTKYMLVGSILTPLVGTSIYVDGNHLVKGDKTIMTIDDKTKWSDVADTLDL